jgi:tetratricopeptide (TPR) repeat protein
MEKWGSALGNRAPQDDNGLTEDDLWAQLDGQVGSERATTLVELVGMHLDRSDAETALPLIDAAVDAAIDSENELMQARSRTTKGIVLFSLERYAESAQEHVAGARLFERYESAEPTCLAYFNASWSFEAAKDFEPALECIDAALATALTLDDPEMVGRCHRQRADVLRSLDRPHEEWLAEMRQARDGFRAAGEADEVINIDLRLADMHLDNGEFDEAIRLLKACRDVAPTQNSGRLAYVQFRLGRALRLARQFPEALKEHQAALAHAVDEQEFAKAAFVLEELALCHWGMGVPDEAFDLLAKSRAHHDAVGRDDMVFDADTQRATWLHIVGRYAEAMEMNEYLLDLGTPEQQFVARVRLADNHRAADQFEQAIAYSSPQGDEDPEWTGTRSWFWRECIRARALQSAARAPEAWTIAQTCLDLADISNADAGLLARFHEMRGDALHASGDDEVARQHWMHAVALYMKFGEHREAERVSAVFLPSAPEG